MKYIVSVLILLISIGGGIYSPIDVKAASSDTLFVSEINFRGSLDPVNKCVNPEHRSEYEINVNFCWKDEWLELFNPSTATIVLDGWKIKLRNKEEIKLTGTIDSGEYFVLGHTHLNGSFVSVIDDFDQVSNKLIHLSSDKADNIFYQLVDPKGTVVDDLDSSHSSIEGPVKQVGQSWGRCYDTTWKREIGIIDTNNFGSPKTGQCQVVNLTTTIDLPPAAIENIPQPDSVVSTPQPVTATPVVTPVVTVTEPATQPIRVASPAVSTSPATTTVSSPALQPTASPSKTSIPAVTRGQPALNDTSRSVQLNNNGDLLGTTTIHQTTLKKLLPVSATNLAQDKSVLTPRFTIMPMMYGSDILLQQVQERFLSYNLWWLVSQLLLTVLISQLIKQYRNNNFYLSPKSYVTKS